MFVKTSSRSAKDSPLASNKFKQLYTQFLSQLNRAGERRPENEQIECLLRAAFECMRVQTGAEAIDMFIRSERVYQDMLLCTAKSPHRFRENFVIREFRNIDVDMEFRGFVFDGRLTALSQYNYLLHSERLCQNKQAIGQLIRDYFGKEIGPRLAVPKFSASYVIDFAVFSSWTIFLLSKLYKINKHFFI